MDATYTDRRRFGTRAAPGSALRRPFRFWMTGSLAVVMAALAPLRDRSEAEAADAAEPERVWRVSRYGVAETVRRIEAAARGHGLSVLVHSGGERPVIVLASSVGGTLVVMDEASARLDMPLSVRLQLQPPARAGAADGGVAVSLGGSRGLEGRWADLPRAVAADLAALPVLIDRALA